MRSAPLRLITLVAAGLAQLGCAPAAAPARGTGGDSHELAARVAAIVDPVIEAGLASGIPGAAFVFVADGRIVYQRGYGFSDVEAGAKADPERTVWPVASVTKPVTAMAALQLVGEGRVDLDSDVNRYLKRLQVPAQGFGPLTLRHLLSHTGGLDELPGRQFDGRGKPDMAAFIQPKLLRYRAPGERTAYSTYGIWLAGIIVEEVSGRSYADYVRRRIFEPAGMKRARIMTSRGDERGVAAPYSIEDGRASRLAHEWYVSTPASSMVASAADMGRLLLIHLGEGRSGARAILPPGLVRAMRAQQSTVHPAVPGWGLGLQLDLVNGRGLAEHGGDIGGFSTLLVMIPEENAGFYIVHHGEGGDLRFRVKRALMDGLYPAKAAAPIPAPDPRHAPLLEEYEGRYLSSLACRSCPRQEDDAFTLRAVADGTISFWKDRWIFVRRDVFVSADGRRTLAFARGNRGKVVAVSGGSWRVADRLDQP